jgi:hypothetical protein
MPPSPLHVRKRLLTESAVADSWLGQNEIDLIGTATVCYSSEDSLHPIEHLLDGCSGQGASHWAGARDNTTETLVFELDRPGRISRIVFDAEERHSPRTQQITMEFSTDRGRTFRVICVQECNFDPRGFTYQRKDLRFDLENVSHLKLTIVPNKSGSGRSALTSLRLFAS